MTFYGMNTNETLNPSAPEGGLYLDGSETLYVLRVGKRLRVLASYGTLGGVEVGKSVPWVTDNGLGHTRSPHPAVVVGVADLAAGTTVGEVPSKALPYYRAK